MSAYISPNNFDGFILCFDLNNLKSLKNLERYAKQIKSNEPVLIVGCKNDLIDISRDNFLKIDTKVK